MPNNEGGIAMLNVLIEYKALRIKNVIRILKNYQENENRISSAIPIKYFKCLDQEYGTILYALRVDMASDLIKKKSIPLFYKECITSFQEILKCTKQWETEMMK